MNTSAASSPSLRLLLEEQPEGEITLLRLQGELVLGPEAESLRAAVRSLVKQGILLDLESLTRLDSVGTGTLLDAVQFVREAGGEVALGALSLAARNVLDLLGLSRRPEQLRIFATAAETRESLRSAPATLEVLPLRPAKPEPAFLGALS